MLFILLIVLLIWTILKYNSFVKLRNLMNEAWSGIDVQLKRRYDLIPNLVSTVKGYSQHEKQVFQEVARMRSVAMSATTIQQKSEAEVGLSHALKTLFAVAENYPELKANQNFLDLQKELTNIENQIQLSRRYYNGVVRNYNTAIEVFPGNLISMIFNFKRAPFFELNINQERENPEVKF